MGHLQYEYKLYQLYQLVLVESDALGTSVSTQDKYKTILSMSTYPCTSTVSIIREVSVLTC